MSGVQRSLRPLPTHRTCAPVPRCTSARVSAVSSETRSPVWMATARSAWSRRPTQRERSGAATALRPRRQSGRTRRSCRSGLAGWPGRAGSGPRARGGAGRRSGTASGSRPAARCGCARCCAGRCAGAPGMPRRARRRGRLGAGRRGRCRCGPGEAEEQAQGVAVGGHGVGAYLALGDQPVGEERLQVPGRARSRSAPGRGLQASAAMASSSGVPANTSYSDVGIITITPIISGYSDARSFPRVPEARDLG